MAKDEPWFRLLIVLGRRRRALVRHRAAGVAI
jgi:hypothetical protein